MWIRIFVMMNLLEFNTLSLTEQAEAVWRGTYLADRQANGLTVQLYALPGFYVELFYDPVGNKILDLRSFTSQQQLSPYLAQINFF